MLEILLFQFSNDSLLFMLKQSHLCGTGIVRTLKVDVFLDGNETLLQQSYTRDCFFLLGQERYHCSAGKFQQACC